MKNIVPISGNLNVQNRKPEVLQRDNDLRRVTRELSRRISSTTTQTGQEDQTNSNVVIPDAFTPDM
jgi:hypothetical protein